MTDYSLKILPNLYVVARLSAGSFILENRMPNTNFYACIQSQDELTLVCEEKLLNQYCEAEFGWRILKILGTLDFSLVGVLAGIAITLADAGVSIFTLSTFQTDFILIKDVMLENAVTALRNANYQVVEE